MIRTAFGPKTFLLGILTAGAALTAALAPSPARADVIYTLGTNNTSGQGPGPWGTVDVSLTSPTTALITFTANEGIPGLTIAFGEMGVNVNAASFTTTQPTNLVLAPGSSLPASWSQNGPSNLDGFGSYKIDWTPTPNGAPDSLLSAQFTITNVGGTWSSQDSVLTPNNAGQFVAMHTFVNGNSSFATDSSHCDTGTPSCGSTSVPEPASLALLGSGLLGLGLIRRRRA